MNTSPRTPDEQSQYPRTQAERTRSEEVRAAGRRDVEKRWGSDPGTYRHAVAYVFGVIIVAAIIAGVTIGFDRYNAALAALVPASLFLGAIGALIIAYRSHRRGKVWPIWQGAAWFLFALMLVALSFPGMAATGGG